MSENSYDFMKDAFAAPLGDFIASIGKGVGEAQAALDEGSLRQTLELYNGNPDDTDAIFKLLREIGYQPTFYVIPKTTAKAKISLAISQKKNSFQSSSRNMLSSMYATPINATNSNTYNLDLNASAEIQFDIVPVPPSELNLVRIMPDIRKRDGDGKIIMEEKKIVYKEYKEVESILTQYGIAYEYDKSEPSEASIIENVSVLNSNKKLILGETPLTSNDTILLEISENIL